MIECTIQNKILFDLLTQEESNFLDFKKEWYKDTGELIFDILCMANSNADSDRYLIIGVENKTKKIEDISNDINRKSEENLHNLIQNSDFNIKPTVFVKSLHTEEGCVDVIIIKNTRYKPYFLLKDKRIKKNMEPRTIRAGVVYTRDGAVNTPINNTASEYQIAQMWQERFGLTLNPLERLSLYIQNTEKWKSTIIDGDAVFYYTDFPEFTIKFHHIEDTDSYDWSEAIGPSYKDNLYFKYHETILKELLCCHVDGGRYFIVYPEFCYVYYKNDFDDINVVKFFETYSDKGKKLSSLCNEEYYQNIIYYQIKNSFDYYVEKIYNSPSSLERFFIHGTKQPILLLNPNDDIHRLCREEFFRRKKLK